jgi:hypothetical protein
MRTTPSMRSSGQRVSTALHQENRFAFTDGIANHSRPADWSVTSTASVTEAALDASAAAASRDANVSLVWFLGHFCCSAHGGAPVTGREPLGTDDDKEHRARLLLAGKDGMSRTSSAQARTSRAGLLTVELEEALA